MTPATEFVELDKGVHDRSSFDCGTPQLNQFLQHSAAKHRAAGISMTMVLPAKDTAADICAFYTLSHTEIQRHTLPRGAGKKLPRYPVPVLLIAQLAVHRATQGRGLGKITLIRALHHAHAINEHLPSHAVVVDALGNAARGFYQQFGFEALDTHPQGTRLFLSMQTVSQLFAE